MHQPRYQYIARMLQAIKNCKKYGNKDWEQTHRRNLIERVNATIPSGSGMDVAVFDLPNSTPDKLVFHVSYHHMNETGYYDGWTRHTLTIKGSLQDGIDIKISGKDRAIKEYIGDAFNDWLNEMVDVDGKTVEESNDAKTN